MVYFPVMLLIVAAAVLLVNLESRMLRVDSKRRVKGLYDGAKAEDVDVLLQEEDLTKE